MFGTVRHNFDFSIPKFIKFAPKRDTEKCLPSHNEKLAKVTDSAGLSLFAGNKSTEVPDFEFLGDEAQPGPKIVSLPSSTSYSVFALRPGDSDDDEDEYYYDLSDMPPISLTLPDFVDETINRRWSVLFGSEEPPLYNYSNQSVGDIPLKAFLFSQPPPSYRDLSWTSDVPRDVLSRYSAFRLDPLPQQPPSSGSKDSTLKEKILEILPAPLRGALEDVSLDYDRYTQSLAVTIGRSPDSTNGVQSENESVWKLGSDISELSITVQDSVIDGTHYQVALWILYWARCSYNHGLESLSISLPELCPPQTSLSINIFSPPATSAFQTLFPNMHTLHWDGNLQFLPVFLPAITSENVRTLKVNTEMSIDDALLLFRRFSKSGLQSVELASLVDRQPILLPEYQAEKEDYKNDGLPIILPHLDSLKLTSAVSLLPFLATLSFPSLCKLELDFNAADSNPEDMIYSFLTSSLLNDSLLYVEVQCDSVLDRQEHLLGLMKQKACSAFVAVVGVGQSAS
ncbi:hypothetical protein GALMADRAFT_580280 [Galerina marginata CBS 339.88]|uniref:Uncharacterized protein n=1 Tax=Galerina marginata (strain CBS 339.88) TaxID=685588 RepID=A0A067T353_GALM3|nr:hypothetical protein GALMADRAFT_580280 [Galerina marginata CBS 339.88]